MPPLIVPIYRAIGAGLAMAIMEVLASLAQEPVYRVPFVTSIVLVMALPDSAAARPRALIGGHLVSCLAGWLSLTLLGPGDLASALGVGLATFAMIATGTLHPPAGLDAFLISTQNLPAHWIVNPVLVGTLLLAIYARGWSEGEKRIAAKLAPARRKAYQGVSQEDKEMPRHLP